MSTSTTNYYAHSFTIALSIGWKRLWGKFAEYFPVFIVGLVISMALGLIENWMLPEKGFMPAMFRIMTGVLISMPIWTGVIFAALEIIRDKPAVLSDLFFPFKRWGQLVIASVIANALFMFGLVLFIIPGLIIRCRLVFVEILVVDRGMDFSEAITTSWNMTKGYSWQIFFLIIISPFIISAGILALIVGAIPALMWLMLSYTSLYAGISASYFKVNTKNDNLDLNSINPA